MKLILLTILVSMSLFGQAASSVYIAQTAQGSADGSSCANAYSILFFATAGNWGNWRVRSEMIPPYTFAG